MLSLSILLIILSDSVNMRDISILYNRISTMVLMYSILQEIVNIFTFYSNISYHGGLFYLSNVSQYFQIFLLIISIVILQLTSFYPIKLLSSIPYKNKLFYKLESYIKISEYPLLILFVLLGGVLLMSTNDFVSIFLSIELQSYGLYLLSTIYRNSELSTIGGLIYFLLGGLSSCFILLGISLIYNNSGSTSLDGLYIIGNINVISHFYTSNYIEFSILIIVLGLLFKVSAAPFHFWSPDVYDSIPTIVTTFVAIVAKISIFILLLQFVFFINNNNIINTSWMYSLFISSFFSLIIGTILGLTQFRIKRLLAYSTISHVGFLLLSLGVSTVESIQAFLFYLTQYSISNLNVFLIIIAMGFNISFYYYNNKKDNEKLVDYVNSPIQLISQLKGYFYINPMLSLSLCITIFSFIGIPPLIGFFGKQMVLSASLDKGYTYLSIVAIVTSVIGGVYYLNLIKEMFFYKSEYKNDSFNFLKINIATTGGVGVKDLFLYDTTKISISDGNCFSISVITLIIGLFIFGNKEWLSMGTILVQLLFYNL